MSNNYCLLSIILYTIEVVMNFLSETDDRVVNVTYIYRASRLEVYKNTCLCF